VQRLLWYPEFGGKAMEGSRPWSRWKCEPVVTAGGMVEWEHRLPSAGSH
jgi:hypothetical protein